MELCKWRQNPPYFTSKGEMDLDNEIAFKFGDSWSEFSIRNSIPTPIAREAMRHFCSRGELTKAIEWEQD
ncbi:Imm1 family immunity protein [Sorangium cellulosum]|uniref:Imm1 family immunity protein n=1 Tax=Sorangium cellulosum TaxID=56 RepID=UPI0011DD7489